MFWFRIHEIQWSRYATLLRAFVMENILLDVPLSPEWSIQWKLSVNWFVYQDHGIEDGLILRREDPIIN